MSLSTDAIEDVQVKTGGTQTYSANFGRNPDGTMQGQSRQFARAGQLSVRFVF